jgi:hypothetical protein
MGIGGADLLWKILEDFSAMPGGGGVHISWGICCKIREAYIQIKNIAPHNTGIMKLNLLAQVALLTIAAACECGSTHERHEWRRPGPGDRKASLPSSHLTSPHLTSPSIPNAKH